MSSLVSIIGIGDLTRKANELVVTTYRPLEIYTFLILEYLVLILIVSFFVRKIRKKFKKRLNINFFFANPMDNQIPSTTFQVF